MTIFVLTSIFHNLPLEAVVYKRRLLKEELTENVVVSLLRFHRLRLIAYATSAIVAIQTVVRI